VQIGLQASTLDPLDDCRGGGEGVLIIRPPYADLEKGLGRLRKVVWEG
jgi:hypothetical protein